LNELWDTRNRLFQRDKFDKWKGSGASEVVDLAHRRAEEVLSQKPRPFPEPDQLSQMAKIVAEYDRKNG
jgi:trimethylamine:corrinoid methyltransferase-like protein